MARRVLIALAVVLSVAVVSVSTVAAGPPSPPPYGVMDPADACPWPDFLDPVLEAEGVQKCLPGNISWTEGEGIRIVSDPLVGSGGAMGWVTFWCESKVGFQYQIVVVGLDPRTGYDVMATDVWTGSTYDLGTLRTDAKGGGVLGGVLRLPPGLYEFDVDVGTALSSPGSDLPGFIVFP